MATKPKQQLQNNLINPAEHKHFNIFIHNSNIPPDGGTIKKLTKQHNNI